MRKNNSRRANSANSDAAVHSVSKFEMTTPSMIAFKLVRCSGDRKR